VDWNGGISNLNVFFFYFTDFFVFGLNYGINFFSGLVGEQGSGTLIIFAASIPKKPSEYNCFNSQKAK
jgi:hypothetical protein